MNDCSTPPPPSTVYGPVRSWRFGRSLGIDPILETSTCSFNCIYCQLGQIQQHVAEQRVYVPTERVERDLRSVDWDLVDVVTISGSGEPTLALNLGEIVALLRRVADKPIHVLTNATLLRDTETRTRLFEADVVAAKLDAVTDEVLHRINRPVEGVTLESILEGIEALRDSPYPGRLALQCMLMPSTVSQVGELAELVARLRPDEVHLNTPKRPYPRSWYRESRGNHGGESPVDQIQLKTISLEEAERAEEILRARNPGVRILSVYQDAPEA